MSTERKSRKTLPLRRWLMLALGFGFIAPVMITAIATYQYIGIDASASAGTVQQNGNPHLVPGVMVVSLILTMVVTAWFLSRMVARPLGATGDAARRISNGDLNVELPSSRVREVAEVNDAFTQMSADLRKSLEQQSRMEQDRRFQVGAIAHDLRTPLFSLRGYLEGLERGIADTPEKRAEYLSIAQEKANALERMVADLSDFTRLEYLEQTPNQQPVDFAQLLNRLVSGLQPQAEAKGVDLVIERTPETGMVNGDPHLLNRALENLLDNALRYTPSGGSIRAQCGVDEGDVWFTIEDTGPGIADDDLPHIFEPLYRGEASRNRRTGGSGLGLTIARRIIIAHGGELSVSNAAAGGAVLMGRLPTDTR